MFRFLLTAIFLLVVMSGSLQGQQKPKIVIAAASDLRFALDSIVAVFPQNAEASMDIVYGSSGKLYEQISNGAPFDIFFSADLLYPDLLREKGLAVSDTYIYGIGRLVLWSKKIDPENQEINSLKDPAVKKVAIANPRHAPYGKRALEALEFYGIEGLIKGKLVYGENISQAAQFVNSGAADIGLIALSLALSPNMQGMGGNYFLIPGESHQPLRQGAVVTRHGKANKLAADFFQFVQGEKARGILRKYGFTEANLE